MRKLPRQHRIRFNMIGNRSNSGAAYGRDRIRRDRAAGIAAAVIPIGDFCRRHRHGRREKTRRQIGNGDADAHAAGEAISLGAVVMMPSVARIRMMLLVFQARLTRRCAMHSETDRRAGEERDRTEQEQKAPGQIAHALQTRGPSRRRQAPCERMVGGWLVCGHGAREC
jgi:hypothetical protein